MISRPRITVLGIFLLFIWTLLIHKYVANEQPNTALDKTSKTTNTTEDFIKRAVEASTEDYFDDNAIKEMCKNQKWDPYLVFTCQSIEGGMGKSHALYCHNHTDMTQATLSSSYCIVYDMRLMLAQV